MARTKLQHTATHRTCYRCRQMKANAEFTWRSNGTPFSACKECNKEMARIRRTAVAAARAKDPWAGWSKAQSKKGAK